MKNNKCIFLHVPKCAGSSIEHVCIENNILIDSVNQVRGINDTNLMNKREKTNVYTTIEAEEDIIFSFTFIRNPYDRLVSAWRDYQVSVDYLDKPFATFVKHFVLGPQGNRDKQWFRWSHVMPFTDQRMKIFDAQLNPIVNFIGKFETLQQDFDTVCDKISLASQKLPHIKKSKHRTKHYTEHYDDELVDIVSTIYSKDIEYFGYKFGD